MIQNNVKKGGETPPDTLYEARSMVDDKLLWYVLNCKLLEK
jgi:hypothetical protein